MPLSGFRELNERRRRARAEARAEPAQRRRRVAPAEGLRRSRRRARSRCGSTASARPRALELESHWETLAWLREHGFPTNPFAERLESIEEVAKRCRRVGDEADRARLRDRRDRDQGRLARPAAAPRRAALAAALGARVQVGADDRGDDARADQDPRRPHGRAQPVGGARAGRGRRRHRLARDAAQRGGHQPQADPRGRPRDRPARRRRDPAGGRAGRRRTSRGRRSSGCRRTARSAASRS